MKKILTILALGIIVIGCTTTKLAETPPGSGNYKKVVEVDPRLTTGLGTATGVNDVIGPINPWHGLVTLGITTIAGVAEWNRRRKQAQLDAVITGVEKADNAAVKKAINEAALDAKVAVGLNAAVKKVTGG